MEEGVKAILKFKNIIDLVDFRDVVGLKWHSINLEQLTITDAFDMKEIELASNAYHAEVIQYPTSN